MCLKSWISYTALIVKERGIYLYLNNLKNKLNILTNNK